MPDWDNAIIIRSPVCCFTKVATIADQFLQFREPFAAKSIVIKLLPVESSDIDMRGESFFECHVIQGHSCQRNTHTKVLYSTRERERERERECVCVCVCVCARACVCNVIFHIKVGNTNAIMFIVHAIATCVYQNSHIEPVCLSMIRKHSMNIHVDSGNFDRSFDAIFV